MNSLIITIVSFIIIYFKGSIAKFSRFLFYTFLFKIIQLYSFFQTPKELDHKILNCYYYNSEQVRFPIEDLCLPISLSPDYTKVEIVYSLYHNKIFRYIEKNTSKKYLQFPIYPIEKLKMGNPNSILSATLKTNGNETDITNLLIEYQGPLKNFYKDIPGYSFKVSDISDMSVSEDSVLIILDSDFEEHTFKFDETIVL